MKRGRSLANLLLKLVVLFGATQVLLALSSDKAFTKFSKDIYFDGFKCPKEFVIFQTNDVQSFVVCAAQCSKHSTCKGLAYQLETRMCVGCPLTCDFRNAKEEFSGSVYYKREVSTRTKLSKLETVENSKDHLAEFEDALDASQMDDYLKTRSGASNKLVFHIKAVDSNRKYEATLCVHGSRGKEVQIQVIGLVYSNDGPSDTICLKLDGASLGTAETDEGNDGGDGWNVFKDTGPIGEAVTLENGNYTLSMTVETDQWGVEFDTIAIRTHNQDPAVAIICNSELV